MFRRGEPQTSSWTTWTDDVYGADPLEVADWAQTEVAIPGCTPSPWSAERPLGGPAGKGLVRLNGSDANDDRHTVQDTTAHERMRTLRGRRHFSLRPGESTLLPQVGGQQGAPLVRESAAPLRPQEGCRWAASRLSRQRIRCGDVPPMRSTTPSNSLRGDFTPQPGPASSARRKLSRQRHTGDSARVGSAMCGFKKSCAQGGHAENEKKDSGQHQEASRRGDNVVPR